MLVIQQLLSQYVAHPCKIYKKRTLCIAVNITDRNVLLRKIAFILHTLFRYRLPYDPVCIILTQRRNMLKFHLHVVPAVIQQNAVPALLCRMQDTVQHQVRLRTAS